MRVCCRRSCALTRCCAGGAGGTLDTGIFHIALKLSGRSSIYDASKTYHNLAAGAFIWISRRGVLGSLLVGVCVCVC